MSEWISVAEIFGENVFNDAVMQERLPKKTHKELKKTIEEGKELQAATADVIAHEMKEWAIEKGATHYLPEEHIVFNNFYATVDRWKDKTRVMFLANSVSIMNPYFIAYDIEPTKEFLSKKDGFIAVHFADSAMFTKQVLSTRFGTFIAGTDYAEYAVNSVFADNHEFLLARKSSNANYLATIETGTGDFSVWIDVESHPMVYYVQTGRPKSEVVWTMDPATMAEGKRFVLYTDRQLQAMRAAFSRGHVKFDGPKARNSFIPIFKR